jgi:hypothetical protein
MLGLMPFGETEIHPYLTPSYNNPLQEVLRDASRYAIEELSYQIVKLWRRMNHRPKEKAEDTRSPSWLLSW